MKTSIEWAEHSVNPIRARHKKTGKVGHYCEKIASGCARCYSSDMQKRFGTPAFGSGQHRDEFDIFLDESKLEEVRRRKKPTRYFWCSMTDFFGDWMESAWLAKCFGVMDATPQHHHMLLTKRPGNIQRMWFKTPWDCCPKCGTRVDDLESEEREELYLMDNEEDGWECRECGGHVSYYRPNVHLYYSASDQPSLEAGIGDLLACRDLTPTLGLSLEPLVGEIKLNRLSCDLCEWTCGHRGVAFVGDYYPNRYPALIDDMDSPGWNTCCSVCGCETARSLIDHVIIGGESGPGARPCNVAWIRSLVRQCRDAGVACFVKQLGSRPCHELPETEGYSWDTVKYHVRDPKGGDMSEWHEEFRVRQFPKSFEGVNA